MAERSPVSRLALDVALYTVARLGLAVVLTLVIFWLARLIGYDDFPLAIAILFALIIALPLGMALFAPLRRRVTAGIAVVDGRRQAARADLQARLRGEESRTEESRTEESRTEEPRTEESEEDS